MIWIAVPYEALFEGWSGVQSLAILYLLLERYYNEKRDAKFVFGMRLYQLIYTKKRA
jgi:hypothetical protein